MRRTMRVASQSPAGTAEIGLKLGRLLRPGDVVCLVGPLGAGKTVFARGIASGLGVEPSAVSSPTFTLAREYAGRVPVYHLDLYRLSGPEDVEDAGLHEYIGGDGVALIEWPEVYDPLSGMDRLAVTIDAPAGDDRRHLEFAAYGARYEKILEEMDLC
ncbi:MAG: tRNA (adenosine(37)-N6)-threonylcarbamoyltransferase complex ATPase subunit type 1 TsaE [Bacillota bacterium]|jgi:tRNA threonylcarbamoyladenosine biosynthesis protein TsaE|nr:tRNA (adenosine(37)-N6)-threonylcarbamoyltransferase complex ATPase subunit type 1 TsaE [Bacillota bacterium]